MEFTNIVTLLLIGFYGFMNTAYSSVTSKDQLGNITKYDWKIIFFWNRLMLLIPVLGIYFFCIPNDIQNREYLNYALFTLNGYSMYTDMVENN